MNVDQLITLHPRLFHMAHHDALSGIRAHGLLSTEALVTKFGISGTKRSEILARRRNVSVRIANPEHGSAVIRDNKPMTDSALAKCLTDGITPTEWYETLNRLVFFWLREQRLERLLAAKAYRGSPQLVLEFDTERLVRAHSRSIVLSPINSGSTLYNPAPRGHRTFQSIEAFPFDEWSKRRGNRREAIVELAVRHQVPDAVNYLTSASLYWPGRPVAQLVLPA